MSVRALSWFNKLPISCFKTAQEKLLLLEISKRQWENGSGCTTSSEELMRESLIARRETFINCIKDLEKKSLIFVTRKIGSRSSYTVNFDFDFQTCTKNSTGSEKETCTKNSTTTCTKTSIGTCTKNSTGSVKTCTKNSTPNIITTINGNKRDINTLVSESVSAPEIQSQKSAQIPNPNSDQPTSNRSSFKPEETQNGTDSRSPENPHHSANPDRCHSLPTSEGIERSNGHDLSDSDRVLLRGDGSALADKLGGANGTGNKAHHSDSETHPDGVGLDSRLSVPNPLRENREGSQLYRSADNGGSDSNNLSVVEAPAPFALTPDEPLARPKKAKARKDLTTLDYKEILSAYTELCQGLPVPKFLSEKRKKEMEARWDDLHKIVPDLTPLKAFRKLFLTVAKSDFLMGRTESHFNCSLDWILKLSNFLKIIEGNFKNMPKSQANQSSPNQKGKKNPSVFTADYYKQDGRYQVGENGRIIVKSEFTP